ncbi:MAG: DNA-directed RNA polymerase subunit alpha, partial [Spirochaetaceae bacterium]|nr:DNA-directed RNA polymerase subunit alpha [Spirochaetaceae bacterium]
MARKNLLKGFKRPKGISFEHISTNPNYGKFTAHPFETGFGTTVGNTLRRVLLSSIQGYAVTSIRITSYDENGIAHVISSEFEAIPNVAEDTLEIINTLKQVRLRLSGDSEQETILYEFKGPGVVKSEDFESYIRAYSPTV